MQYNLDFDIGSMLFFSFTIYVFLRSKRMRDLQERVFGLMLMMGALALVFDFMAGFAQRYAMQFPVWSLYAFNMLFIFGMQACLPLLLIYSVLSAGMYYRMKPWLKAAAFVPYGLMLVLLFSSPLGRFGVFYIDEAHLYQYGATHLVLYINTVVYVLAGVGVLTRYFNRIPRIKRTLILIFVGLLFIAVALQMLFPNLLLTASATALGLTALFYAVQSPEDHINPFTGALSRTTLPTLLSNLTEQGQAYTLLLFSIVSFNNIILVYGGAVGDSVLKRSAAWLMARYPHDAVVYMDASEFVVVLHGRVSRETVSAYAASVPRVMESADGAIPLDVRIGMLESGSGTPDMNIAMADYMFLQMHRSGSSGIHFADDAYKKRCIAVMELSSRLPDILAAAHLNRDTRRTVRLDGVCIGEDALLRPPQSEAYAITNAQLLEAIGRAGQIWPYYEKLLSAFYERRKDFRPGRRLCLPLSVAAFVQEGAADTLSSLIFRSGFRPEQLMFSVPEAEVASAMPSLHDNMRAAAKLGCTFRLDGFAAGYTDFSLLSSLPIAFVRLDEALFTEAAHDAKKRSLLIGMVSVLHSLGADTVCGGAKCAEDLSRAADIGAVAVQGAYTANMPS